MLSMFTCRCLITGGMWRQCEKTPRQIHRKIHTYPKLYKYLTQNSRLCSWVPNVYLHCKIVFFPLRTYSIDLR